MALSNVPPDLLKQLPAGVTPVDAISAPSGGYWVLGKDGGVFAIGGAPFLGSYPGLPPSGRQGTRNFVAIQPDPSGTGYRLIGNDNSRYDFPGPPSAQTVTAPPPSAPPPATDVTKTSAFATVSTFLSSIGLGGLTPMVTDLLRTTPGISADEIKQAIRTTPEYQQRFPAMKDLSARGEAITEAQYVDLERSYRQILREHGLPPGFYDNPEDFHQLISGGVSPVELQNRVKVAASAALQAPADVRANLHDLGVSPGDLTAFFLDPTQATPVIMQKYQAKQAGFGLLTDEEARAMAGLGLSPEETAKGFADLAQKRELTQALPGEQGTGLTQSQQLGAEFFGDVAAQQQIERTARQRVAEFAGGGRMAISGTGVTGLESSTS